MGMVKLRLTPEKCKNVFHAEFTNCLSAFNGCLSKSALGLLKLNDAFLDGIMDRQTVDCYINSLIQPMNTINGLFFNELYGVSTS